MAETSARGAIRVRHQAGSTKRAARGLTPLVIALMIGVSCARHAVPVAWEYDKQVGVVAVMPDRVCLTVKDASLAPDTRVRVIDPMRRQESLAFVIAPAESCVRPADNDPRLRGYAMRFDGAASHAPFLGMAIIGSSATFRELGGSMAADLDGDGEPEFLRSCSSSEGLHLTIWSRLPLLGSRRWHRYYSLGYDVDPTCTTAESSGP